MTRNRAAHPHSPHPSPLHRSPPPPPAQNLSCRRRAIQQGGASSHGDGCPSLLEKWRRSADGADARIGESMVVAAGSGERARREEHRRHGLADLRTLVESGRRRKIGGGVLHPSPAKLGSIFGECCRNHTCSPVVVFRCFFPVFYHRGADGFLVVVLIHHQKFRTRW